MRAFLLLLLVVSSACYSDFETISCVFTEILNRDGLQTTETTYPNMVRSGRNLSVGDAVEAPIRNEITYVYDSNKDQYFESHRVGLFPIPRYQRIDEGVEGGVVLYHDYHPMQTWKPGVDVHGQRHAPVIHGSVQRIVTIAPNKRAILTVVGVERGDVSSFVSYGSCR